MTLIAGSKQRHLLIAGPWQVMTLIAGSKQRHLLIAGPWQVMTLIAGSKQRHLLIAGDDDEMFMTRSFNITPKTTEQHFILRSDIICSLCN